MASPIPPFMAILFALIIPCVAACFTCCFVKCRIFHRPAPSDGKTAEMEDGTKSAEPAATPPEGDAAGEKQQEEPSPSWTEGLNWAVCAPVTLVAGVLTSFFAVAIIAAIFAVAGGLEMFLFSPISDSACSASCTFEVRGNGENWVTDDNCCSYTDGGPLALPRQDVWLQYPTTVGNGGTNVIHGHVMVNSTAAIPGAPRLSILYFHGSGNNVAAGYRLERYAQYLSIGNVAIFAFDYPGYGKSPGQPSSYSVTGTVEASEAAAVWFANWDSQYSTASGFPPVPPSTLAAPIVLSAADELSSTSLRNITLLGRSMGGCMASWVAAGAPITGKPRGLALQSTFSFDDLPKYYFPMYYWAVTGTARRNFPEYRTRENVAAYLAGTAAADRCVFHSHSESDRWVPMWMANKIRDVLDSGGAFAQACSAQYTAAAALHTQPMVEPEERAATLAWLAGRRV